MDWHACWRHNQNLTCFRRIVAKDGQEVTSWAKLGLFASKPRSPHQRGQLRFHSKYLRRSLLINIYKDIVKTKHPSAMRTANIAIELRYSSTPPLKSKIEATKNNPAISRCDQNFPWNTWYISMRFIIIRTRPDTRSDTATMTTSTRIQPINKPNNNFLAYRAGESTAPISMSFIILCD